jgi:hypothetical protein
MILDKKPFAESCEQNKQPILGALKEIFNEQGTLLEIGSGTGQHAVYFSEHLPHLLWQPTEMEDQIAGMKLWLQDAQHNRIKKPDVLNVDSESWPYSEMDYVFTANTTHIVSWPCVQSMFKGIAKVLKQGGLFAQYGPFNYDGEFTSESNKSFDQWLKGRDPASGIRNFEDLALLAKENNMVLYSDYEMPANNRILVWQKRTSEVAG